MTLPTTRPATRRQPTSHSSHSSHPGCSPLARSTAHWHAAQPTGTQHSPLARSTAHPTSAHTDPPPANRRPHAAARPTPRGRAYARGAEGPGAGGGGKTGSVTVFDALPVCKLAGGYAMCVTLARTPRPPIAARRSAPPTIVPSIIHNCDPLYQLHVLLPMSDVRC